MDNEPTNIATRLEAWIERQQQRLEYLNLVYEVPPRGRVNDVVKNLLAPLSAYIGLKRLDFSPWEELRLEARRTIITIDAYFRIINRGGREPHSKAEEIMGEEFYTREGFSPLSQEETKREYKRLRIPASESIAHVNHLHQLVFGRDLDFDAEKSPEQF